MTEPTNPFQFTPGWFWAGLLALLTSLVTLFAPILRPIRKIVTQWAESFELWLAKKGLFNSLKIIDFHVKEDSLSNTGSRLEGEITLENKLPIGNRLRSVSGSADGHFILLSTIMDSIVIPINGRETIPFLGRISKKPAPEYKFELTIIDVIGKHYTRSAVVGSPF